MKVTLQSTGVYSLGVWHFLLVYKQTRKQRESFRSCLVCWVTFPGRYGEVLKHRDLPWSTRMTSVSAVQQPCQKELCLGKRGLLQYDAGKACPCLHSTSSCAGCGDWAGLSLRFSSTEDPIFCPHFRASLCFL